MGLIDGAYYVPRIDKDILVKYKEGLIVTTGSLNSEVPFTIINQGEQQGEEAFLWFKEQFGEDFYVEINRQYQTRDEEYANEILLKFAKKHDVTYFAANSNYYIDKKGSFFARYFDRC